MDESPGRFTATMEASGEGTEMPEESQSPPSQDVFTDVSLVPEHEKKELEDAISKLEGDIAELRSEWRHLDAKRRAALDKLLDLKGSIRVFCRVRSFLQMEKRNRPAPITLGQEKVMIHGMGKKKDYVFDRVFSYEASQEDVFVEIEPILRSALDGHSVCIFAYGQTGTGKTFTMEGSPDSHGIVPRAIKALLDQSSLDNAVSFKFSLSMVEVYMGHLKDLLAHRPPTRMESACMSRSLSMQTDSNGSVEIDGLIEVPLTDFAQAHKSYVMGRKARSTCWTNVNETSSRSHCLTRLTITRNEGGKTVLSKLWMVDLGGSERLLKTRATGQILDEGRAINLSLSALGDVISALRRKRNHIPYRNSKLTQILKDSLGHDSKALVVIHITSKEDDICETICSLNFGQRARGVECHKELSEELRNLRRKQIAELDQQLKDAEQDCQKVGVRVQRLECTLLEKKRILSVTYGLEDQTGSPTSPLTAPKELFDSPKASEKTIARNVSASVPRFMAPTACSRQRQLADREAKAAKMQRSGMKHRTEIDFHLSRSRTLIQSDSNFKTSIPTGLLVRSSLKKLRTEELSSVQSDAASLDSSKIVRAQHNRRFSASLSASQTRHLSDLNMQKRISDRRSSCEVSRYPSKNVRLIRSSMPSCLELINGAGYHSLAESQC